MRKKFNYPELTRGHVIQEIVGGETRMLNDN